MAIDDVLTRENFDLLLWWLDQNRDQAGAKYEEIRRRLIRMFIGRGCLEAEHLADETINRVSLKLPALAENYDGEPKHYFFAVAVNVHSEWARKQRRMTETERDFVARPDGPDSDDGYECLQSCLNQLPEDQRKLIINYYEDEKAAKIARRSALASELNLSTNALHIKTSRIRSSLRTCIEKCLRRASDG